MKRSSIWWWVLSLGLTTALAGCSPREEAKAVAAVDISAVRADMQAVAKSRILLGHKSVGRNILAGLEELETETGVPLRIETIDGIPPDAEPGLFHSEIGENGDPDGKCEIFSHLLTRPERPAYDLAMMKFCYSDLKQDTALESAAMLERYSRLIGDLQVQRPDVRMVHVTLPLRADPPGKKTTLKRFLGLSTDADANNVLRNAFNAGLRQRFSAEPMFDLAMIESTRADGSRSAFSDNGQTIYTLASEYTEDGGHLNAAGRRRAAIEFVRVLASALPKDS